MRTLPPFDLRKNIPTLSTVGTAEDVSHNLTSLASTYRKLASHGHQPRAQRALIKSKLDGKARYICCKRDGLLDFFQLCNLKQVSTISEYNPKFNELLQKREERLLRTTTITLFLQGLRANIKILTLNEVKQGKIYKLDQVQQFVDTYKVDSKGSKITTYEPPPNTSFNKVKPFFNNNNTNNPAVWKRHTTFPLKKRPTTKTTKVPQSSQTATDYMAAPQKLHNLKLHNHGFWTLAQLRVGYLFKAI
ncbi:hypothetical protein DFS34DRAFT_606339 [Phlyctochytrium arcticum]|nr:hypothetical protein DFS34DRAFT_606339 [Phlyctochytrium arcticum]